MKRLLWMVGWAWLGCAHAEAGGAAPPRSLYERLGGKPAISAVVDNLVGRLAQDDRINIRFANTDIVHLRLMLVDQICQATGGPCTYSGKDMKTAHRNLNITNDEWTALVEDLLAALGELRVASSEQQELLGALGGLKGDIVGQ